MEVPTGLVLPTKSVNFKLLSAKLEECNVGTNNGALLDSLPRNDFGFALG